MASIVPTITAMNTTEYARQLARLEFAPRIHIDIADGDFAPSRTVNLNQLYWDDDKVVDLHLMVRRPAEWLHQVVALAPNLVVLHVESDDANENLPKIAAHLGKFGIKFGIAILPETTVESVQNLIEIADYVLVFGGHLGYQGGTADLMQLSKAMQIRTINPDIEIAWDGGANADNITEIARAGIDVINVGSAIMESDEPEKAYKELLDFCGTL
ncbi:hypothetical protein FWF74_03900 [Candidatus Saccharibacteria bacterium]|nr:hypothetical protein [Candidatus Saccharibacteria bacterium]